jgi:hypothetical protein
LNPENSKIDCNSGGQVEEVGSGNLEVGSGTRRRQIGLDYAAAKDVEMGIRKSEVGSRNAEVGIWKVEMGKAEQ